MLRIGCCEEHYNVAKTHPTVLVVLTPMVLNTNFDLLHDALTKIATNDEAYSAPVARAQMNNTEGDYLSQRSFDAENSAVGADSSSSTSGKSFDADIPSTKTRSASRSRSSYDPERSQSVFSTTNSQQSLDPERATTPRSSAKIFAEVKHPRGRPSYI